MKVLHVVHLTSPDQRLYSQFPMACCFEVGKWGSYLQQPFLRHYLYFLGVRCTGCGQTSHQSCVFLPSCVCLLLFLGQCFCQYFSIFKEMSPPHVIIIQCPFLASGIVSASTRKLFLKSFLSGIVPSSISIVLTMTQMIYQIVCQKRLHSKNMCYYFHT